MIQALTAWGPAALWAAILFFLSAQPDLGAPAWIPHADKTGHLGLYGLLGAALAWGRHRSRATPGAETGDRTTDAAVMALGVLYGASDEWHQSFVPGRDASFGDFLADTIGVVAGYAFLALILRQFGDDRGATASPRA